jgi:hypothetical protein
VIAVMATRSAILGVLVAVSVLVSSCSPEPDATVPESVPAPVARPGASAPATAVTELLAALSAGDFERAAQLTVDDQMLSIAVTGNVPTDALQGVLATGGSDIGRNYWESFAANLEGFLGVRPDQVTTGSVSEIEVDGVSFAIVALTVPGDSIPRRLVVQQTDGWKVDVVASFGPALAQRLGRAAEAFRVDPSAADILASLSRQRSSLQVSLDAPGLDPETAQVIRSAMVSLGG